MYLAPNLSNCLVSSVSLVDTIKAVLKVFPQEAKFVKFSELDNSVTFE